MLARVVSVRVVLLLWVCACFGSAGGCGSSSGGGSGSPDLAAPSSGDAAAGFDAAGDLAGSDANSAAEDLAGSDANGAAGDDLQPPAVDLGDVDLGDVDLANADLLGSGASDLSPGTCAPAGSPALISGTTRQAMVWPLLASDDTQTMVLWKRYSGTSPDYVAGKVLWALVKNGAVVASGDHPGADTRFYTPSLFAFAGTFYFREMSKLYKFDPVAATWSAVSGLVPSRVSVSGGTLLSVQYGGAYYIARLYDGSTVGGDQKLDAPEILAIAPDGGGGFGVFTLDAAVGQSRTIGFYRYDGVAWSAKTTVAAVNPYTASSFTAAGNGTTWALLGWNANGASAYVGAGSTWTASTFSGISSTTFALAMNGSTFGAAGDAGWVATYSAGAWTQKQLGTAPPGTFVQIAPFGAGFLDVFGGTYASNNPGLRAALYDGAAWSSSATVLTAGIEPASLPSVAVRSGAAAVAYSTSGPKVVTFDGASWSTPTALGATVARDPAVSYAGSSLLAVYPEPGVMTARRSTGGAFDTPFGLPSSPASGAVSSYDLAHASTGHTLAVWSQYDVETSKIFGAEHDGTSWGAPVYLADGSDPHVATNGTTFLVSWHDPTAERRSDVALWSGAATPAFTQLGLGSSNVRIASDHASYVAVWLDPYSSYQIFFSTSSTGATWSAPGTVEGAGGYRTMDGLVGGPAGVLEWSTGGSQQETARVWRSSTGTWSAATTIQAQVSGVPCAGAVGDTSALLACNGYTQLDSREFTGGAWVTRTPDSTVKGQPIALASNGSAFRLQYPVATDNTMRSVTLRDGAWSAPLAEPNVTLPSSSSQWAYALAATGCGWTLVFSNLARALRVAHAAGDGTFDVSTALPGTQPSLPLLFGRTSDALFGDAAPATSGVVALYGAHDL